MLLIRNLAQIATPSGSAGLRGKSMRSLRVIEDGVIVVRDGFFAFVGREDDLPLDVRQSITEDFDARGATALPGFVDTHTHIPFAGFRESEFNRRLQGESYEQIAESGGGIASSVRATRQATEEELVENVLTRGRMMVRHGTTTAEAKSGYGLSLDAELKQLRAIRTAAERAPLRLVPPCPAPHEFHPARRGDPPSGHRIPGDIPQSVV